MFDLVEAWIRLSSPSLLLLSPGLAAFLLEMQCLFLRLFFYKTASIASLQLAMAALLERGKIKLSLFQATQVSCKYTRLVNNNSKGGVVCFCLLLITGFL